MNFMGDACGKAPGNGQLVDEARRKGIAARALLDVDLAVDRNGRPADRFWERVMFPICDRFGAPIAFSGRLLPAAERKANTVTLLERLFGKGVVVDKTRSA